MPLRPCLDCGTPASSTRCTRCEARKQQARNAQRTHYHGDWAALSRRTRDQWVATHGWVCPGWQSPPHPARDLVVDHVQQRSRQALAVLCRSCNSRKSVNER